MSRQNSRLNKLARRTTRALRKQKSLKEHPPLCVLVPGKVVKSHFYRLRKGLPCSHRAASLHPDYVQPVYEPTDAPMKGLADILST